MLKHFQVSLNKTGNGWLSAPPTDEELNEQIEAICFTLNETGKKLVAAFVVNVKIPNPGGIEGTVTEPRLVVISDKKE